MKELNFKQFISEQTEEENNIINTLKNLPQQYQNLIKGYKFKFHKGNTLHNDDDHIGVIDPNTKTVTLAGPWNYSRSFVFLHELAHKVWEKFLSSSLKEEWEKICKETKSKFNLKKYEGLDQNSEELFCHNFAAYYCNNPPQIYCHKSWKEFMKNLEKFIK